MDAEDWLTDTERKMNAVGANDEEKVCYATHLLSGPATSWWENKVTLQLPEKVFTWEEFKEKFRTFNVSDSVVELKRREFEDLKQSNSTMMSYIKEFNQLSRYASDKVSTDAKRVKRFLEGLDPYAAMQMKLNKPQNFQELMDTAINWENDYQLVQLSRQKKVKLEAKRFQPSQSTTNLSFKPRIKSEGSSTNWERSTPRDQIICHNCGLPGHMKRDCDKPRVACHACGKEGHIRPECPKKPPGGWPVKGRGRPGAGGRQSSGGGNNGKNNNDKRDRSSRKLNCTTLEEADTSQTYL
jgi:hypothetical protein